MTQHKDMERASKFAEHLKTTGCIRLLPEFYAAFNIPDEHSDFVSSITEDGVEEIASLIAQVRNETLDAVDKMIEAQAAFYFSFSNELDDYESKLAQSHFDMAKRIRNLKQEDKE